MHTGAICETQLLLAMCKGRRGAYFWEGAYFPDYTVIVYIRAEFRGDINYLLVLFGRRRIHYGLLLSTANPKSVQPKKFICRSGLGAHLVLVPHILFLY